MAATTAVLHQAENLVYHRHLRHLPDPAVQRVSCLQTENGFYYSYYGGLVEAKTVASGLREIVWDTRSEYPETLNALRRFNIYQEVVLALLYRALRTCGMALVDAWDFFRYTLLLHNSLGQAAIALLAAEVSGNPLAGILCFLLSFLNRFQMSRLGSYASAGLREHWGIPLLWMQTLCLWHILAGTWRGSPRGRRLLQVLFAIVTFLFVVSWQFSPFLLLLQATALYFVCLVAGYRDIRPAVVGAIDAYLVAMGLAFLVHFGSPYLLTSPFLAQIVALKVATSLRALCAWTRRGSAEPAGCCRMLACWVGRRGLDVLEGLVALAAFAAVLKAMAPFATADTHVYDLLCTKAAVVNKWLPASVQLPESRLPECTEPSFNARLYLIMGVFKEIEEASLNLYRLTTAGPAAAATCALVLVRCVLGGALRAGWAVRTGKSKSEPDVLQVEPPRAASPEGLRRRKAGDKQPSAPNSGTAPAAPAAGVTERTSLEDAEHEQVAAEEAEEAALLFFVLQFLLFLLLGFLINRLRVAFAPPMMVLAASCCGPRLFAVGPLRRRRRLRLALLALLTFAHLGLLVGVARLLPCADDEEGICSQMTEKKTNDGDLVDLMEWMNEHLPQNQSVLASMNLAGTLRAFTGHPLIIHPQFESENLRKRVQLAYELYHCGTEESFAQTMQRLHAEVVIFEYARCFFTPYLLDDRRKNCIKGKHHPEDQLCLKLHASSGRFRLIFMNGGYGVFRLQAPAAAGALNAPLDTSPEEVARVLADRKTWVPYVKECVARQGDRCAARLAESAATWYHGLKRPPVANTLRQLAVQKFPQDPVVAYAMGRFLDYDMKRSHEAGQHYELAARLLPNNALVLKEYLLWLDMEAKDTATVRRILQERGGSRGLGHAAGASTPAEAAPRALLDLEGAGAPELMCESAVSARELGLTALSKKLWARSLELAPLSTCARHNWKLIYPDGNYDAEHTRWARFWAFVAAGVSHEVGSHHFPAVRYAERRKFALSPKWNESDS